MTKSEGKNADVYMYKVRSCPSSCNSRMHAYFSVLCYNLKTSTKWVVCSVFNQLDDRRVDAEKKIVTLQETNVSLTEKYQVEKQQNIKYKVKPLPSMTYLYVISKQHFSCLP